MIKKIINYFKGERFVKEIEKVREEIQQVSNLQSRVPVQPITVDLPKIELDELSNMLSPLKIKTGDKSRINTRNIAYQRLINASTFYYISSLLVIAGWVFINIKDILNHSNGFQYRELVTNFPNILYPVYAILITNIIFLGVSSSLWYNYILTLIQLKFLYLSDTPQNQLFVSNYTLLSSIPYAIVVFCIPSMFSIFIFIKMFNWVSDLPMGIAIYTYIIYGVLLLLFLVIWIFIFFLSRDLYKKNLLNG